jgi:Flp pilus assembly protein TadG
MRNYPLTLFARFRRDRSAAAAIEMAFIAPVMIILALLGVDTANYVIATEQVEQAANTIAQMISTTGPWATGANSGNITNIDLAFYFNSTPLVFPGLLDDAARQKVTWPNDINVSMSSIWFTATPSNCTTNCTYTGRTMWASATSSQAARHCGVQNPVADASVPTLSTIPTDVVPTGPAPSALSAYTLIVVDISFTYHPLFASYFGVQLPIQRSVYIAPRYVPLINYLPAAGNPLAGMTATWCPGSGLT